MKANYYITAADDVKSEVGKACKKKRQEQEQTVQLVSR